MGYRYLSQTRPAGGQGGAPDCWCRPTRLRRRTPRTRRNGWQHLLGRAEISRAADWLEDRAQLGRDVFGRGQTDGAGVIRAGRTGDVTALLQACLVGVRLPAEAGAATGCPGRRSGAWPTRPRGSGAMLPEVGEEGAALETFLPEVPVDAPERELRCRVAVAGTFLAGLELTRDGTAEFTQVVDWRSIRVGKPKLPRAVAH